MTGIGRAARIAALVCGLGAGPAGAGAATIENAALRYSIVVPDGCVQTAGPGTLEARCAPDLDAGAGAAIASALAFLLEVDAERVPEGAAAYAEADFRAELPDQVCGEADASKVRLANVGRRAEVAADNFSADVTCPAVRFLRLPERRASVRMVTAGGFRYRLMARAPAEDWERVKGAAEAFLASFKVAPPPAQ